MIKSRYIQPDIYKQKYTNRDIQTEIYKQRYTKRDIQKGAGLNPTPLKCW